MWTVEKRCALSPCHVNILPDIKTQQPPVIHPHTNTNIMSDLAADGFNASDLFKELGEGLQDESIKKKAVSAVKAVIVITLKNKEGKDQSWVLDLKKDGTIKKADSVPKNDVQLLLKDADFVKLASGKANGQKLFMNGKLKVKGNMMKATAIESVFKNLDPRGGKAKL